MLSDVLSYDKMEHGELKLELSLVSVKALVNDTVKEFQNNVDFSLNFACDPNENREQKPHDYSLVVGDPIRLAQCIRTRLSSLPKWVACRNTEVGEDPGTSITFSKNGEDYALLATGEIYIAVQWRWYDRESTANSIWVRGSV